MASADALNDARLAAAKAKAGLTTTPIAAPVMDEQTKIQGARDALAAAKVGYGGNVGSSVTNQASNIDNPTYGLQTAAPVTETAAERLARITAERQTGNGTEPPSEAPAGTHWSFIGGQWKLYKDAPSGDASGYDPIVDTKDNGDGTITNTYKSGKKTTVKTYNPGGGGNNAPGAAWTWDGTKWTKPPIPTDGKTYTWDDTKGWVTSELNTATQTATQVDSIAAISALLSSYGIGDLSASILAAVKKGYSSSTIQLVMQDPNSNDPLAVAFQTRFPANKARLAAGKSVLSAAEYLSAERTYAQIFQSYGVSSLAKRDMYNQFITNDISASEVTDRVGLAINRVQNADADTKQALKDYYPMLNQNDIVTAMLNPLEGLPALQRKVQVAEIGGAALGQGLTAGMTVAEQLASQGVTKAEAQKGYANIADILPGAQKLSNIYGATQDVYGQTQGEQEVFGQLASAERKRKGLIATEVGTFGATSGNARGAFSTGYLSKQSPAGQF
jgi:hypothetical protein